MRVNFRVFSACITASGFGLCLAAYYPGLLSPDSANMYVQAIDLVFNDWHSVVMPLVWAPLYLAFGGSQGMLILLLVLYWGALFVLADAAAHIEHRIAPAMLGLGFMPFTINFVGTLWSDVLVATSWLMCTALVFSAELREQPMPAPCKLLVWLLFLVGAWTRYNALFAALPIGLYLLTPRSEVRFGKRAALACLLLMGLWFGNWTISYSATKTSPVHSIVTYDLAGISHFSHINYFPVVFSPEEMNMLSSCYTPQEWDNYGWGKCRFVARRLHDQGFWGSPLLWRAWIAAVAAEPVAYLRHRSSHFLQFLTDIHYIFHEGNSPEEIRRHLDENVSFKAMHHFVLGARGLWMFHPVFWLVSACACLLLGSTAISPQPSRRYVIALSSSALLYLATYFFVGIASDFRYAYWAVLATSVSAVILVCELAVHPKRSPAAGIAAAPDIPPREAMCEKCR